MTFLSTAMEWFPKKRGLAAGVSALGSGFSGFVFAAIQSAFINPWNHLPDHAPYPVRPENISIALSSFNYLMIDFRSDYIILLFVSGRIT